MIVEVGSTWWELQHSVITILVIDIDCGLQLVIVLARMLLSSNTVKPLR